MKVTWLCYRYLVLPAHKVDDWQWLQRLGDAAGLSRSSWVVMLIQGQNLLTINKKKCKKILTQKETMY